MSGGRVLAKRERRRKRRLKVTKRQRADYNKLYEGVVMRGIENWKRFLARLATDVASSQ